MQENLGLSDEQLEVALADVNIVTHSAASIELEADVQNTLRANYLGTKRLLDIAARMKKLRAFVHVSTAYVNVNKPKHSSVDEALYPLNLGTQPVSHETVVEDLLSLNSESANVRVSKT